MPLDIERIVDDGVSLEETLRRCSTLEALHLRLAPSDDEVEILCPIVVAK